jgi:hypothetical protein
MAGGFELLYMCKWRAIEREIDASCQPAVDERRGSPRAYRMRFMKLDFWVIVAGALILAFVAAGAIAGSGPQRRNYGEPTLQQHIARYTLAAAWLGIVWTIIFRSELERRKLSLRSLFALVAIQAFGLWLVQITLDPF